MLLAGWHKARKILFRKFQRFPFARPSLTQMWKMNWLIQQTVIIWHVDRLYHKYKPWQNKFDCGIYVQWKFCRKTGIVLVVIINTAAETFMIYSLWLHLNVINGNLPVQISDDLNIIEQLSTTGHIQCFMPHTVQRKTEIRFG